MAYPYNPIASSTNPYLNSILHGTAWNTSASNGSAAKVITYSIDDGSLAFSPTQAEAATFTQAEAALINSAVQCYENVCDIDFVQVPLGNPNDPEHYENIAFVACNQDMVYFLYEGGSFAGAATFPLGDNWLNKFIDIEDWDNALFDVSAVYINCDDEYLTQDVTLAQGGGAHYLILHEFGHALGLAHPHDNNGRSSVFPGVLSPRDFGDYDLNQAIFTTMSYNEGWQAEFGYFFHWEYGHNGTPGAFDIAALQQLYGANTSYKTGADTYVLPTVNDIGTFFSCLWDAGGDDTISNQGSSFACTINLIAAPLTGPNAGGYVSWNDCILGGYTIANGVIIENAIGGAGDDFIAGNEFDNTINGDAGSDLLDGGAGNDSLNGGSGNDTLQASAGNDVLYGGSGTAANTDSNEIDTFVLSGNASDYTISRATDSLFGYVYYIKDNRDASPDGLDTLYDIDQLQFTDVIIAPPPDEKPVFINYSLNLHHINNDFSLSLPAASAGQLSSIVLNGSTTTYGPATSSGTYGSMTVSATGATSFTGNTAAIGAQGISLLTDSFSINATKGTQIATGTYNVSIANPTAENTLLITATASGSIDGISFGSTATTGAYAGTLLSSINLGAAADTATLTDAAGTTATLSLNGGVGSDRLNGNASANNLTLTGLDQGTLDLVAFSSIENIYLEGGNDNVTIQAGGRLSGILDGGAGSNSLVVDGSYMISIGDGGTIVVDNGSGGGGSFSGFQNIGGGGGVGGTPQTNSLTLNTNSNVIAITGHNSGTADGTAFTNISDINLAAGDDNAILAAVGSLTGTLSGGTGTDDLTLNATINTVVLSQSGAGTATSTGNAISTAFNGFEIIRLDAGNDTAELDLNGTTDLTSKRQLRLDGGLGNDQLTLWLNAQERQNLITTNQLAALQAFVTNPTGQTLTISLLEVDLELTGFETAVLITPNNTPTGTPTLSGTFKGGQVITIDCTPLQDADNFTGYTPTYSYSFEVSNDNGNTWTKLTTPDATDNNTTYTLTTSEVGKQLRGAVSYLDGHGTNEAVYSDLSTVLIGNQAPTDLSLSSSAFTENIDAASVIGSFASADPDTGNTFAYSLVSGIGSTDNTAFTINGNQLKINASPDFESKSTYSIRVRTTDQDGLSFDRQVLLLVSDVNEAPTTLSLSTSSFNEAVAAGTAVATLSSLDPDAGNTFTYSLVSGDGSTDNAAFSIAGDQLKITASPDFEAKSSYAIRLRTTDQGGLSFDRQLTLLLAKKGQTQEARDLTYTTSTGQTTSARITTTSGTFDGDVILNRLTAAPVYSNQNSNLSIGRTGIAFSLNINSNSNSQTAKLAVDLAPLLDGVNTTQKRLAYFVYSTPVGQAAPIASPFTYDPVKKAGARFFDLDGNGSADTADLQFVDGGYGDKDGSKNGVIVDPSTAGAVDLNAVFTATANSLTVSDPTDTSSPAALVVRASLSSRSSSVNQIGYVALNANETLSLSYDLVKERGTLLFGTLSNNDVPDTSKMKFQRDINLINSQKLMFFEVVDNTLEAMLKSGSLDSSFRTLDVSKQTDISATAGKGGSILNLFLSTDVSGLGELISSQMGEAPIFDFSNLAGQSLTGDVLIAREASYDSTIGFYKLERSDGAVRDSLTNSLILPGEVGYAAVALRSTNLFSGFGSLATSNRTNKSADLEAFKDAGLLAPFARVANTGETYFSFAAANSDGLSHFRVLGSGLLGLEDIKGGGDRDFDDLIVGFNFKLSTVTMA